MTECIHSLFAAWGATSPEERETLTDAAIGPEFYYADPNTPTAITDRATYLEYIAMFSQAMPGGSARVVDIAEHHGHVRATVEFLKDGTPMMRGQVTYSPEDVRAFADEVRKHSGESMTRLFPEDTGGKPSEAKPTVWTEWVQGSKSPSAQRVALEGQEKRD